MSKVTIGDRVRLVVDVPELSLRKGTEGIVCSTWLSPAVAYEVRFTEGATRTIEVRALLTEEQVEKCES